MQGKFIQLSFLLDKLSALVGADKHVFSHIAVFYVFIQIVIYAKVAVYFFFTGAGQTPTIYSYTLFFDPVFFFNSFLSYNSVQRFDLLFHQSMHFLIAYCAFAFARHTPRAGLFGLLAVFFIGSVLHNVGYWLTNVFSNLELLLYDFAIDIVLLLFFYYLFRFANRVQIIRSIRLPLLE